MIIQVFRYFILLYCSSQIYKKLLNTNFDRPYSTVHITVYFLLIAFISSKLFDNNLISKTIFLVLSFSMFIFLYSKIKMNVSFIASILSLGVSFISLTISSLLVCIIIMPFNYNNASFPLEICIVISGILQYILIHLLFKIKRLQKGMPFLIKSSFLNIGMVICMIVIIYFVFLSEIASTMYVIHLLSMLLVVLLSLPLLIWWRRKITQSYVEKLRVSEVEALYKEISDKEHEIEKLHSNNRYLARIIHKDNKLIPAMELAVRNYLQNGMQMKPEDARQYGIDLLAQLQTMAADREGIIQNYHDDYRFRPQIGLYSVDAIIYYMERRAIPHSIRYEYQFDKGLKEVMLSYIDENDAIHLLSDAIENSIIATMHAIKKEIKIHIGFIQDILFMDISDTGLPFEPATYQNFGLLQHTTHKDSGGSGVGLLDIWKLKHKYKISLQIYEYSPDDHEYTKKIRFFFDRRNHFLIQSYRSQEITSLITRSDLHVFPYVEGSDFILTLDEEITEETE